MKLISSFVENHKSQGRKTLLENEYNRGTTTSVLHNDLKASYNMMKEWENEFETERRNTRRSKWNKWMNNWTHRQDTAHKHLQPIAASIDISNIKETNNIEFMTQAQLQDDTPVITIYLTATVIKLGRGGV